MGLTSFAKPAQWLLEYLGTGSGSGRVHVNADTALQNAAVWYGINKISGNIGSLPCELMRLNPDGTREKATAHRNYALLKYRPNDFQIPITFKQTLTQHAIMWGNGRAYIHRSGNKTELLPLYPDRTITGLVDGKKYHATMPGKSDCICSAEDLVASMAENSSQTVTIPDEDVIHIQGFGHGVCGLSLFEVARWSLEVSLGADRRASKQMVKGFAGKLAITAPPGVLRQQEKAEQLIKELREEHSADGKAEEIMLLREGLGAEVLSMSNKDAEFIEQRMFQRQEAALWLMLESILGDDSSVSYNSEEQKQLAYVKNCLMTWLIRWEQELNRKLLTTAELNQGYYFDIDTAALLRPDFPTLVDTLCKGIAHELFSPNVALDKLGMNPYEGGDRYRNPNTTSHTDSEPDIIEQTDNDSAMAAHLQHMLGIEQKKVQTFLDRNDSYEHIDTWYEGWIDRLTDVISKYGGDYQIAQNHCVRSLNAVKRKPETFDLAGSEELIIQEIKGNA